MFLTVLPELVIIFDTAMLENKFGPAKSSALKIIDELRRKNIIVGNYILISFDEGLRLIYCILFQIFQISQG